MHFFYLCITLSDFADLAQVIIAITNLFLAYYVFVYQKTQSQKGVKLQWFKELIIQPNLKYLHQYYDNLEKLKTKISTDVLSEDEILELNRFINDESKAFRTSFCDAVLHVDKTLYEKIKANSADLVSKLTTTISDDEHKLTNPKTLDREILEPIRYARNNVLAMIFKYTG
jgi:hypothetical protein